MKNAIARPLRDAVNGLFFCMRREADISTELFLFFLAYNMQKFFFKIAMRNMKSHLFHSNQIFCF